MIFAYHVDVLQIFRAETPRVQGFGRSTCRIGVREIPPRSVGVLSLIRFGGHLPKGEYDVDHDGDEGQADAAELHG